MKRIRIEVTQDDIDKGREEVAHGAAPSVACMTAQAIQRIGLADVVVAPWELLFGGHTWVSLPRIAQRAILAFDRGEPVKPFAFTLLVPAEIAAQVAK